MPSGQFWTDEEIEQLKKLHNEGLAYSEIATALKKSRSAVGGQIRRLKLSESSRMESSRGPNTGRSKVGRPPKRQRPSKPRVAAPPPTFTEPPAPPREKPSPRPRTPAKPKLAKRRVRLPDELKDEEVLEHWVEDLQPPSKDIHDIPRDRQCKYIYGDVKHGKNPHWCRKPTHKNTSWCKKHLKKIYPEMK